MTREASHELDVIFEIWMRGLLQHVHSTTDIRDVVVRVCTTCVHRVVRVLVYNRLLLYYTRVHVLHVPGIQ